MAASRILGIVLIIGGVLALVYGGFSYTKNTQEAKVGPVELNVKEKKHVNVPMWAGVVAVVAGGVLLFLPARRT